MHFFCNFDKLSTITQLQKILSEIKVSNQALSI